MLEKSDFKSGVGIQGMRARVRQLNGAFEIESGLGGATVTAVLPFNFSA
jgi:signal transduction histidine kinase